MSDTATVEPERIRTLEETSFGELDEADQQTIQQAFDRWLEKKEQAQAAYDAKLPQEEALYEDFGMHVSSELRHLRTESTQAAQARNKELIAFKSVCAKIGIEWDSIFSGLAEGRIKTDLPTLEIVHLHGTVVTEDSDGQEHETEFNTPDYA